MLTISRMLEQNRQGYGGHHLAVYIPENRCRSIKEEKPFAQIAIRHPSRDW